MLVQVNEEVDKQLIQLVSQGFFYDGIQVPVSVYHNNDGRNDPIL